MRPFDKDAAMEILVTHANIDMTRRHIACLHSLTWLNDEVINMYMALLQVRHVLGDCAQRHCMQWVLRKPSRPQNYAMAL